MKLLDVGIGLALVYLLLSLVVTSVMELWAAARDKRSLVLRQGLEAMLGAAAQRIYNHGLIKSLQIGRGPPSYIPSGTFSLALLDLVAKDASSTEDYARALADPAKANELGPQLVEVLRPLIHAAEGKVDQLRANVEGWFNAAMDRVSGTYRRSTQAGLVVVSLIVAVSMDVDTIRIATAFLSSEALRDASVALVERAIADPEIQAKVRRARDQAAEPDSRVERMAGDAAGARVERAVIVPREEQPAASVGEGGVQDISEARRRVEESLGHVYEMGMPIGWSDSAKAYFWKHPFISLLGMLATALAISLGAPFWFDVLNKIVAIRSTVKPKKKKEGEADVSST